MKWIVFILLLPVGAWGTTTPIGSLPYTASQAGTNYSETLTVTGTNLTSNTDGINFTGHDIVLLLQDDTITFAQSTSGGNYGLSLSSSAYNIKVVGGWVISNPDDTSDNYLYCAKFTGANDVQFEGTSFISRGDDSKCLEGPSISAPGNWNITFDTCQFWQKCRSYTSRCAGDGTAIGLGHGWEAAMEEPGFTHHYKLNGCRIREGYSQGMIIGGRLLDAQYAVVVITSCTLTADARNTKYLSGDVTCHSAANPYQIFITSCGPGTVVKHNVISSGESYGGSRGIYADHNRGDTLESYVKICSNYVDVHEGINLEEPVGHLQVLRMRYYNVWVWVFDNTFIGTGDTLSSTPAYGEDVMACRFSSLTDTADELNAFPDSFNIIERNLFRATTDSGAEAHAMVIESEPNSTNIFRYNVYKSNNICYNLGGNNGGANGVTTQGDTMQMASDTFDFMTIAVGWGDYYSSSDDTIRDAIYVDGASDDEDVFAYPGGGGNVTFQETAELRVVDMNDNPVSGAVTYFISSYTGDTVCSGVTVLGRDSCLCTYKKLIDGSADSTGWNPYTFVASYLGQSVSDTMSLDWDDDDIQIKLDSISVLHTIKSATLSNVKM